MTIRSFAIAFAFCLLATAVTAEPPPPAPGNRPDAALEAFAARVGVDLASTIGYARTGITTYEMFEAQKTAVLLEPMTPWM